MKPTLLFVYGTLRKGWGNHRLIEKAPLIGKGTIKALMYSAGLPYVIPGDGTVVGEVYQIDSADLWNRLDALGSHPS